MGYIVRVGKQYVMAAFINQTAYKLVDDWMFATEMSEEQADEIAAKYHGTVVCI